MRQLIAGNWKMNMLRAPASELRQGGARRRPGAGVRSAGVSAVHRRSRPSRRAGGFGRGGRRPGLPHRSGQGAHTGDVSAAMLRDAGRELGDPRPFRAPPEPRRDRRTGAREGAGGGRGRPDADRLRRRDRGSAGRRAGDRGGGLADCRQPAEAIRRRGRLRAGVGDRHRPDRDRTGRGHDARASSARNWCASSARRGRGSASSTAARCGRRMPARCSPCRMSAAA